MAEFDWHGYLQMYLAPEIEVVQITIDRSWSSSRLPRNSDSTEQQRRSFLLRNEGTSVRSNYLLMGIGITTGIYIFVRRMDNLDKNLPAGWRGPWDRVFRGKLNAQR